MASTTGLVIAGTGVSVTPSNYNTGINGHSGDQVWSNPSRVTAQDSSNATWSNPGTSYSQVLVAKNFGFAIPAGSTILEVNVRVRGVKSSGSETWYVGIVLNGNPACAGTGDLNLYANGNTATGSMALGITSLANYDYAFGSQVKPFTNSGAGGSLLLGAARAITPADVNSSSFGIAIGRSGTNGGPLAIDAVWVEIVTDGGGRSQTFTSEIDETLSVAAVLSKTSPSANSASGNILPSAATNFRGGTSGPDSTWSNPGNVFSNDGSFCSGFFGTSSSSQALLISNFGLSIPTGSTIRGVEVVIRAQTSSGSGQLQAALFSNSSNITWSTASQVFLGYDGSSKALGVSTTLTDITLGSASDAWGGYWPPATLNGSGFGVLIQKVLGDTGATFSIDSVSVNIHYTAPTGVKSFSTVISEASTYAPKIIRGRTTNFTSSEFVNVAAQLSKSTSGPTTVGPRNPTTSSGTGWTGTANVYAQDGVNATITPVTAGSAPLVVQGFNFSIPTGATINGISFDAYAYQAGGSLGAIDVVVNAVKSSGAASSGSATTTSIDTTPSYKTYGSSSSMWGETWTYADINNANFGVQLTPTATGGGSGGTTTSGYATGGTASSTSATLGSWGPNTSSLVNDMANADSAFVYYACNGGSLATDPTRNPYLTVSNFGFSIPTGATIAAVEVSINRRFNDNGGGSSCKFETVQLVVGGTPTGTNKGNSTAWPGSYAYDTYGDTTSDLWGCTLAPSDVNSSSFGVTLRVVGVNSNTDGTPRIDHLRVRVSYTTPSTPDRVFTVDHVRATVNYTPVDQTVKLVSFNIAETSGMSSSFTRNRELPFSYSESTAVTSAINRNRTVSVEIDELYDIVADIIRARNVPIQLSIDQVETVLAALNVSRAPVTQTLLPMTVTEGTGTVGWVNTGNVFSQDGAVAYIDVAASGNKTLRLTNFGYAIPPQVQILGVEFDAYEYQSGGTLGTIDVQAKLIKADGSTSASSQTITSVNTTPSYKTYGSSSTLWGLTLTGADVNSPSFGVELTPIGVPAAGGGTTTSYIFPGTATYDELGGPGWTNLSNILVDDGAGAFATAAGTSFTTDPIHVSNFGLSIPTGATINAVEVSIKASSSPSNTVNPNFSYVQLEQGGSVLGTSKSNASQLTTTSTYYTLGDVTSDVWGATLTPAILNSSTFGVVLQLARPFNSNGADMLIDAVRIRVSYTVPTGPDRRLNVDYVRATVTYIPIDLKQIGNIVVDYLEAMNAAMGRGRPATLTVAETEAQAISRIARTRDVGHLSIVENESLTANLGLFRSLAVTLAESVGHQFSIARLRQLQPATISELETFSFGALRRIRQVITGWNEVLTTAVSTVRARGIASFTVAEHETISAAIIRARKVIATLNEQLQVTTLLGKQKMLTATISELESLTVFFLKVKLMTAVLNYTETVGVNVIRTRALEQLISEVETETVAVNRNRHVSTVIPQTTQVNVTLGRFRKVLASVLETEVTNFTQVDRIREVIASVAEQEHVDFALSIILGSSFPESIGIAITWYEQETKVDGTINFKLMSETWTARRAIEMSNAVVVDIAIPATQVINLDS